jgi:hypothetical protein
MCRPALQGVNHPNFTHITPTVYLLRYADYPIGTTFHVAQVAEYIQFDKEIREFHESFRVTSYPAGYLEFTKAWNEGAASNDPRHFSLLYIADDAKDNDAYPSDNPVSLSDFHITAAQAGLTSDESHQPNTALQDDITQEFAAIMVTKQRRQREFIEESRQKRIRAFDAGEITPFRAPARNQQRPNRKHPNKLKVNKKPISAHSDVYTTKTPAAPAENVVSIESTSSSAPMEVAH